MNDGSAPWIKIITRIFENPKIIALEQLPEGSGVVLTFFKLLTLAGEQNRGGAIYFTDRVSFTADLLAAKWRCKPALVQMALQAFEKFGMIGIDNEGTIWILNWNKYQNEEGLALIRDRNLQRLEDRSPESVKERVARKRERDVERQRRRREKLKRNAQAIPKGCPDDGLAIGAVTRHGAVTRDAGVTGVTVTQAKRDTCVTVTPQSVETQPSGQPSVTPQTKIETKRREEKNTQVHIIHGVTRKPAELVERKGDISFEDAQKWLNSLFGRQKEHWNYEEQQLLSELLPIPKIDRALLSWAYKLPRDKEGWAIVNETCQSKPKQSLGALLRDFQSEIDKWRTVHSNLNGSRNEPDVPLPAEWIAAAVELYGPEYVPPPCMRLLPMSVEQDIKEELERQRHASAAA
jgi:predicted phage replisome organizer